MATCLRCRADPCRCTLDALEVRLDDDVLADVLADQLAPAYAAWLRGGSVGPEPLTPPDVRRQVRALLGK